VATPRDIQRRIRSVQSTQKITRAMKLVAAAKLRRAQERVVEARPYASRMAEVLGGLALRCDPGAHPLLARRETGRKVLMVISADRGLCGAFNTNIIRRSLDLLRGATGEVQFSLTVVGRKVRDFYRRRPYTLRSEYANFFDKLASEHAAEIAGDLIRAYAEEAFDQVELVYNEFRSVPTQRVKVETLNPTTSETVKVYYAINRSATFQLMTNSTYTTGVITASGVHTFEFPSVDSWVSTTALTGTAFRSIQFRIVFARGSTNTNSPDVLSLTLEYYKKMDAKWQFQVDVDMNTEFGGRSQKEQRAALLTAMETATLLEFTYRDPSSNSDATFYVQVQPLESAEQQGFDERGVTTLQLREV